MDKCKVAQELVKLAKSLVSAGELRNEYDGELYRTSYERDRAMVVDWLTAGGRYSEDEVIDILSKSNLKKLAREMLNDWDDDYLTVKSVEGIMEDILGEHI